MRSYKLVQARSSTCYVSGFRTLRCHAQEAHAHPASLPQSRADAMYARLHTRLYNAARSSRLKDAKERNVAAFVRSK